MHHDDPLFVLKIKKVNKLIVNNIIYDKSLIPNLYVDKSLYLFMYYTYLMSKTFHVKYRG